jgi:hypothetical protein
MTRTSIKIFLVTCPLIIKDPESSIMNFISYSVGGSSIIEEALFVMKGFF